jgi:hypothetical protein
MKHYVCTATEGFSKHADWAVFSLDPPMAHGSESAR